MDAGAQDDEVRQAASAMRRAPDEALADLPLAPADARQLNDAARTALQRRGSAREAAELQLRAFGAKVVRARAVMHGKTSRIAHDGRGAFSDLPNPFEAARYHSLVVDRASLPDCLEIAAEVARDDAESEETEIMALRHKTLPIESVQFHPEASPGPLDALPFFDRLAETCRSAPTFARS